MTFEEVMKELEKLGTDQYKKIYRNHGCDINVFGVSVANLKKVLKPIKKDVDLGMKLLKSNNADAIYLSQWIVDSSVLTISDIVELVTSTNYYMILDTVVTNIVYRNKDLNEYVLTNWISHSNPRYRQVAYGLYSIVLSKLPNEEININEVQELLWHIENVIHTEENRVKYSMNSFLISAGIYIPSLTEYTITMSERIGKVEVFMGDTSCKVPFAPEYIRKVEKMGKIGLKR